MGAKSGMESGAREPSVAGDGAGVCVDGEIGAAAFSSDKAANEAAGGGSRAAGSALFSLGVDVFHICLSGGAASSVRRCFQAV